MRTGTLEIIELKKNVLDVFASVTRYPVEILEPEADLEEDLGIDSVKLGEVFSVLREKFRLPEKMGIPPEKLKTINSISDALYQYLSPQNNGSTFPELSEEKVDHSSLATKPMIKAEINKDELKKNIINVFAELTRYPLEILDPEANLEEDLGVDSVKLGEVFSVLREKYQLPERIGIPPEDLITINRISAALYNYLSEGSQDSLYMETETLSAKTANTQTKVSIPQRKQINNGQIAQTSFTSLTGGLKPFKDKIAFISGSGRGLGRDIAFYLAELGATVIVNSFHSRNSGIATVEEIKAKGGEARHIWGSMAHPDQLHAIFDEIEKEFDALDFFISNASNGMLARLENITVEHWQKAFKTSVVGLHQASLRAVRLMKKRQGGKIITMSTPAAHRYVDYFGCVGAVKAAVESLTKTMAIEFSPYNVAVNCVSLGPVYGELLEQWPESEQLIRHWEEKTAYKRLCAPRDASHFIAYLLSEPVKIFNGSILVMDGGISSQGW